jgi:hypothetical protein
MRMITLTVAASMALLSSGALAQSAESVGDPPAVSLPKVGGPQVSGSDAGLNKLGDDGVSTKTVQAVGCSTAARETDGTTTCVGIPGPIGNATNGRGARSRAGSPARR